MRAIAFSCATLGEINSEIERYNDICEGDGEEIVDIDIEPYLVGEQHEENIQASVIGVNKKAIYYHHMFMATLYICPKEI